MSKVFLIRYDPAYPDFPWVAICELCNRELNRYRDLRWAKMYLKQHIAGKHMDIPKKAKE